MLSQRTIPRRVFKCRIKFPEYDSLNDIYVCLQYSVYSNHKVIILSGYFILFLRGVLINYFLLLLLYVKPCL